MKRILTLIACLVFSYSQADQLAYITKDQAQKATDFLKQQKEVILWCACCDGDAKRLITLSNVSYASTGYQNFYQVSIDGKDSTGANITEKLDLAYVHYNASGMATCVGKALNFDCKPCTDPFTWPTSGSVQVLNGIKKSYIMNSKMVSDLYVYRDGKKNGVCKRYYTSGKIESQTAYSADDKYGFEKHFYESGKTQGEILYINETMLLILNFHESGKLKSAQVRIEQDDKVTLGTPENYSESEDASPKNKMKDGKKDGKWREYVNENDSIQQDSTHSAYYRIADYKEGIPDGPVTEYYRNGNLFKELFYMKGAQNGPAEWYFSTGELQEQAMYKNGQKHGLAIAFYKDGVINKEVDYGEDGTKGTVRSYTEDGKLK